MRNFIKKGLSIILIWAVLTQLLCVGVFAAGEREQESFYKNFVIFGDSICLGFSTEAASMADNSTYDIERNLLRAVLSEDYQHCYPTQFAAKLGLNPFEGISYPDGTWDYKTETEWDDVYNFGICAAWSSDIKELLTNPFYLYQYASANYGKDDTFVLPEEYIGIRSVVDTEAEGYNVADSSTWKYRTSEEYIDHYEEQYNWWTGESAMVPVYKSEEYTIPAGSTIPVAYEYEMWGSSYLSLNPIISEKYFYVSEHSLDKEGNFTDTNKDGVIDNADITYYPTAKRQEAWGSQYVPNTEEYSDTLGKAIQNPQFTKYYYDLATTVVEQGDLIALAMGNNDIYHSFMPYQQSSNSMLCKLVYWLSYALQMNYSVNDIMNMLQDPMWQGMIFGSSITVQSDNTAPLAANGVESDGEAPALLDAEPSVPDEEDNKEPVDISDSSGSSVNFGSLISIDEINALLNLYSSENVTAYLEDTVEKYKNNYEATIQRILELKQDDAELVLVGHYNPFGMVNYLTMLSEAAQNGQLYEHLSGDMASLGTMLQAIIGTPEQWDEINEMSEEELLEYADNADREMSNFLFKLGNLDLNDEDVDQSLTQMIVDLSFPLSVLLVGDALADTYENMNGFLQKMAEKYDLVYIDVSDAPSSGRYDPHPTEYGHTWIAERFYKTVVPEITASISNASTGEGVLTPLGNREFRLRDNQTYRFLAKDSSDISAIFIDGEQLNKEEFASIYADGQYTFEKIMASHSLTIQFDKDEDGARKYAVNVLGSYAKYGAGEGMYKAGDTVSINAGALDGFEFTGWKAEGVDMANSTSASTTFEMPTNAVTVTATWKVVEDEPEHIPPQHIIVHNETTTYDLSFETNGGTGIPAYTKKSGTVIDLNAFFTTRDGYDFAGWYSNKELTQIITSVTLAKDTTVYAKWTEKTDVNLPFTDVKESDWFHSDVLYAYANGLMRGTGATLFSPNATTTRGMIVTILYRLEGEPEVSGKCQFDDVKSGSYYEDAITWAAANGIVGGYGEGKFGPDDNITREQMAAILYRYAKYKGYDSSDKADLGKFTDSGKIGTWAEDAMAWANANALVNGVSTTVLDPQGEATRAQVAAILHRFCENIAK